MRFYRVTELVTQLMEAREERQLGRLKSQLAKLDLLILDELGYVPASKAGAELLFDVISTAYERTSVIVTTNLPFEQWPEVLLSERLTGAALDRLTHRCQILETGAESYRLRDAKRRRRSPAGEPGRPGSDPAGHRQQAIRQVAWESGVAHFTRRASPLSRRRSHGRVWYYRFVDADGVKLRAEGVPRPPGDGGNGPRGGVACRPDPGRADRPQGRGPPSPRRPRPVRSPGRVASPSDRRRPYL